MDTTVSQSTAAGDDRPAPVDRREKRAPLRLVCDEATDSALTLDQTSFSGMDYNRSSITPP
jgi:hypothetical protein